MTRLDQHIAAVRNKLTLGLFIKSLAWLSLGYAGLVWVVILAERLLDRTVPHHGVLFLVGCGVTVAGALGYGLWRRPNEKMTAVAIDEKLGLKEKFSTALYVRPMNDPFAAAAVKDAEREATQVSLYQRFPLEFPRQSAATGLVALGAILTWAFLPAMHLWGNTPPAAVVQKETTPPPISQRFPKEGLPKIEASLNEMNDNKDAIRLALDQLNPLNTREGDINHSNRSALEALENVKKALAEEMANNEKFQTAMDDQKILSDMDNARDDSTPMGKAQNDIKEGKLDEAANNISAAGSNFDKMSAEDQKKTIEQAQAMAAALANAANNPQTQQKIQQKLQQMGATAQQAQQMAQAMQQAAAGNPQGQQQMQQLANQIAQGMNAGKGPTSNQQALMKQMMTQAQGMINSQAQAQTMAASAGQMARAMQQAGSQSQQGQSGQHGAGKQQMASAAQQMQSQLKNMQAQSKDAQALKDAAAAAADAASDCANGLNPGAGNGNQQANSQGNGGNAHGQGNGQQGNPAAGGGKGPGGAQMPIAEAPFDTKAEVDPGLENKDGKVLASRYVKAGIDAGKSTAELRAVAASAEKEAPDEIDTDHVSRDAQQAVKDYFSAMQNASDGQ